MLDEIIRLSKYLKRSEQTGDIEVKSDQKIMFSEEMENVVLKE